MTRDPAKEDKRSFATRAIGDVTSKVMRRAFGRKGFAEARIVTHWREIVGDQLARHTLPERIAFRKETRDQGTLHLRADGGYALELQHLEPILIERINAFFGYGAVARVHIQQGPIPGAHVDAPKPRKRIAAPKGEGLEDALKRLEAGIAADDEARQETARS